MLLRMIISNRNICKLYRLEIIAESEALAVILLASVVVVEGL